MSAAGSAVSGALVGGLVAYTLAGALHWLHLWRPAGFPQGLGLARRALGAGAALHGAHVVGASLVTRTCPVFSLHFALSLSAVMMVVGYLVLRGARRLDSIGVVVAPVALTFLVGAQFVTPVAPGEVSRPLLAVHVTSNLVGVGLFLLAGALGAFYLVQERRLKQKRAMADRRLPPLDALDQAEHRLLMAGFPLLTIGVATGAALGGAGEGAAALLRVVLAWLAWGLVGLVLALRAAAGWRGRRAAYGALLGTLCVVSVIVLYAARGGGGGS